MSHMGKPKNDHPRSGLEFHYPSNQYQRHILHQTHGGNPKVIRLFRDVGFWVYQISSFPMYLPVQAVLPMLLVMVNTFLETPRILYPVTHLGRLGLSLDRTTVWVERHRSMRVTGVLKNVKQRNRPRHWPIVRVTMTKKIEGGSLKRHSW